MQSTIVLKYAYILLIFLWSSSIIGQEKYMGFVSDVGSRTPVEKVLVVSSQSGKTSSSDKSGFFQTELYTGNIATLDNHYYILNNVFYFGLGKEMSFSLYSLDGKAIMKKKIANKGTITLPKLPIGYYVIELYSSSNRLMFFLFSNGKTKSLVQRKNTTTPIIQTDSSLVFSKKGYFSRELFLPDKDSIFFINILKEEYDSLDYFNELLRHEAFVMLHSSPPISNYGEVMSIKALYDINANKMYYSNAKKYKSHYVFSKKILGFTGSNLDFYHTQYGSSPYRFLNLVTINYYKNIDKYVFEFGAYDQVDCEGISKTYENLLETSFFGDKLFFYPNNLKWKDCSDVPTIDSEEIYFGQNYQALNLENGYGFLRKVDVKDLSDTYLGRHDVVLLNGVPNDLSVISGIITTKFQTPLSHINILSHNRKTPNMALRDGWDSPLLDSLIDELVYLKVESDSFIIRKASIEEATLFWNKREPHSPVVLEKDTETTGLIDLNNQGVSSVKLIGGKAANFAELVKLGNIPVPENYFAIPFYYYQKHIKNNGIDTVIDKLLNEEKFKTNIEYRKLKLKELRNLIKDAPLDQWLINAVKNRIKNFSDFTSFRFRSSTNAEDLENFSGTGLYDSYSAKKGHS